MKETLKGKVIPNILLEKRDSNIPLPKRPLSKLDPDDMIKILDNNERDKITKELYKNEAERASATIKLFDKKIRDNPTISNKEINIITHLKNIYELRGEYYVNKFNNEPEKNKFIDIKSIDNNIYQLENELRDQKGSGALPKYEYLTKKDLNYKPNAFEQAKFEYSPLGKVFIDGLDKSDRKEGLLKRLKNIEDKNNNQLLALRDINRPAIRGRNNGDDDDDNDDNNDDE